MSEVERLREELRAERAAREDAETQVQQWRRKSIDERINNMNSRVGLTKQKEEAVETATPKKGLNKDDPEINALLKENEALVQQREKLCKVITDLQKAGSPDREGSPDDVEKERRARRASDALVEAQRVQLETAEKRCRDAEKEADRYRIDVERMKNLLASAEEIIVQHRLALDELQGTDSASRSSSKRNSVRPVRVTSDAAKSTFQPSWAIVGLSSLVAALAGTGSAVLYFKRKSN